MYVNEDYNNSGIYLLTHNSDDIEQMLKILHSVTPKNAAAQYCLYPKCLDKL